MGNKLSKYTTGRDNNFNLIRLIAALLVLYTHSFALATGSSHLEPLRSTLGLSWGVIAVDVFFITSGFLITGSYLSRKSLATFIRARVLRIYPALITSVIFCVFIVGLWLTTANKLDYLLDPQTSKFLLKNSSLVFGVEFQLPGVFKDVPWKNIVNGSLWTLPYEIAMYALLATALFTHSYLKRAQAYISLKQALLLAALLGLMLHITNHFTHNLPENSIRLFFMFFSGAAFYVWRDKVELSTKWFLTLIILVLAASMDEDVFFVAYYLFLPYLIFYIAYVPAGHIRQFNKLGDYSYGVYIYAFPVQQAIANITPGISPYQMLTFASAVTLSLAIFSWHFIEKPCLKMKKV